MNMNTADRQVIAMVNAPHDRKTREAARRMKKLQVMQKREANVKRFLWLMIKLELYVIAACTMILALGHGWVEVGTGIVGLMCCIVGSFMELWRHEGRRR